MPKGETFPRDLHSHFPNVIWFLRETFPNPKPPYFGLHTRILPKLDNQTYQL